MAKTPAQATTELGRQLEKERLARELSIEEWCAELQVSRQQYLQWRTRPVELQLINARRIATVFGITITVVYGWVDVDVPIIHVPVWFRRPIEQTVRTVSLAA